MLNLKKNKKGFVGSLNTVIGIMLGVFIVAAILVGLNSLQTSLTAGSAAANATSNAQLMGQNFTAQLPTVGTLLGVGLIILAVVGFAGYAIAGRGQ